MHNNEYHHTVVIATEKLSNSKAKPRCYDNFEGDNNRVVIFIINTCCDDVCFLDYRFISLFPSLDYEFISTRSLMVKCFPSIERALKFITLAVYLTAVIATGVE